MSFHRDGGNAWIANDGMRYIFNVNLGNQGDQEFWINKGKDFGYGAVSKSLVITNEQYNLINSFNSVPSNINWTYFYTCASYSTEIWNFVTGDHLYASDNLGVATPRALSSSIQAYLTGVFAPRTGSNSSF